MDLVEAIKKTVSREDVKYVIGYKKEGSRVSPAFAFSEKDAEDFIFSPLCVHNLAVYPLLEEPLLEGKVGVVVKGCDSRAIVQIIQEKGLKREDIVLIGIPCTGVVDLKKVNKEIEDIKEEEDSFIITSQGTSKKVPKEELMPEKCKHCENPTPVLYDILIGKEIKSDKREDYKEIIEFEKKTLEEKWKYWSEQFERCIRCYACRNICPLCYCKECMVDKLSPQWIRRSVNLSENTAWNIMRAYHLAGRCIGCGECERACPMDIPLTKLNKKIEKDIKEMFGYTPGISIEEKPLLAMFKPEDPEVGE
jgi:ferredoxin